MAPDEEDRLPIEVPEQEDPEAKRAAMAAEHSEVIDELSVPVPEIADDPSMSPVHDVSSVPAETLDDSIDEPQRGRYYVKPQDRTPANREERRAEHDRVIGEMSQPGTAPVADNLQDYFSQLDKDGQLDATGAPKDDRGDNPKSTEEQAFRTFFDADSNNRNEVANMLLNHARRVDEITERLERARV